MEEWKTLKASGTRPSFGCVCAQVDIFSSERNASISSGGFTGFAKISNRCPCERASSSKAAVSLFPEINRTLQCPDFNRCLNAVHGVHDNICDEELEFACPCKFQSLFTAVHSHGFKATNVQHHCTRVCNRFVVVDDKYSSRRFHGASEGPGGPV